MDGAEEEKSLVVPAHGRLRYRLTPQPAGARFVHSHVMSMSDLNRGTYTGQFAFVYIEPKNNPGQYDQEIFLATHEWEPFFTTAEMEEEPDAEQRASKEARRRTKSRTAGRSAISDSPSTASAWVIGEPVRVKEGQRVLFHILNASATENIQLALPGHQFQVVALDGNPVPHPQLVDVLELGHGGAHRRRGGDEEPGRLDSGDSHGRRPQERHGDRGRIRRQERRAALDQAAEEAVGLYHIRREPRRRRTPTKPFRWSSARSTAARAVSTAGPSTARRFDEKAEPRVLHKGKRYRLVFDNQTDDAHPVHLHRNSFELTNVNGKPTAGVHEGRRAGERLPEDRGGCHAGDGRADAVPLPSAAPHGLRVQDALQRRMRQATTAAPPPVERRLSSLC